MTLNRPSALPLLLPAARKAQVSLARLWALYNKQLLARPVAARSATAVVGLVAGDVLAQWSAGEQYDLARSLRVAVYAGCLSAPVCHKFYTFLDKAVFPGAPTSWKAVVAKVLIDQLAFNPPLMCVYLSAMKMMEGCPHEAVETIRKKAIPCLTAGFAFWGPAHVLNFRVVPDSSRSLVVLGFGVVWSAILSAVTAQKPQAISHLNQNQLNCTHAIKVVGWNCNT